MKSWALALGVSFALHLAAVIALKPEVAAPTVAPHVEKRGDGFVSFTAVSLVPRQGAPEPAAPSKPAPARVPTKVLTAPVGAEPAGPPVAEVTQPQEGPSGPTGPAAEAEGPATEAPASSGRGAAELVAPVPSGGEGPGNEEVIALVHARLAAAADRCYPAAARRFQQRGTVQLSFCADANGRTEKALVLQSSGAELLDAAARGCVLESAVPFPREANGRCFSVPVRFGLPR